MPGINYTPGLERSTVTDEVTIERDSLKPESNSDDRPRDPRDRLRMERTLDAFLRRADRGWG